MKKILKTVVIVLVVLFALSQVGCRSKLYRGPSKNFSAQQEIKVNDK